MYFVCDISEIQKKGYVIKFIEDIKDEIIVFYNLNKEIKIFSSICPHFGGEIILDKKSFQLKCKWHDWKFCSNTGKCLSYPIKGKLNPYDFEVNPDNLKNYSYELRENNNKIYLKI